MTIFFHRKLITRQVSYFLALLILTFYPIAAFAATVTETTCTDFDDGSHSNTACSSNILALSDGQTSGTFTSQVIDVGGSASWSNLAWSPTFPYGKELVDSGVDESGYTDGNVDMTDIELLYHLNESSGDVQDTSGNNRDGSVTGATYSATGKLNTALSFDGSSDYIEDSDFPFLSGSFSIAAWVKVGTTPKDSLYRGIITRGGTFESNTNFVMAYRYRVEDSGHYMMCRYRNAGTHYTYGSYKFGSSPQGTWHHVVCVYDTATNDGELFIDGVSVNTTSGLGGDPADGSQSLMIGRNYANASSDHYFIGDVDEVGIWSRVLGSDEVLDLYKRGALNATFDIRSCDDASCSGESWAGESYNELDNSGTSPPSLSINPSDNQYIQYKVDFVGDGTYEPAIEDVTFTYTLAGGGGGVPEFSDVLYIITIAFGLFYTIQKVQPKLT